MYLKFSEALYKMITIIIISQNDPVHHQAEIQSGEACVLTKEVMFSIVSNLAIMVLDVNFINPYETADFLFFNGNLLQPRLFGFVKNVI